MKLIRLLGILFLFTFLVGSTAHAVTFEIIDVTGGDPDNLSVGETFTVELVVRLDPGDEINALGSSAYAYNLDEMNMLLDDPIIAFVEGAAVEELFYQTPAALEPGDPTCDVVPSACLPSDPITNTRAMMPIEERVVTPGEGFEGTMEVEFIAAISLTDMFMAQEFEDPGLDGEPGTAQFTFTFEGANPGTTEIIFGTGSDLDGIVGGNNPGTTTNEMLPVTVPEPGSIAAAMASLGSVAFVIGMRRRQG